MNIKTLIIDEYGNIKVRIDGVIYAPVNLIIVNGTKWKNWKQYDEIDFEGFTRCIHLREESE